MTCLAWFMEYLIGQQCIIVVKLFYLFGECVDIVLFDEYLWIDVLDL